MKVIKKKWKWYVKASGVGPVEAPIAQAGKVGCQLQESESYVQIRQSEND